MGHSFQPNCERCRAKCTAVPLVAWASRPASTSTKALTSTLTHVFISIRFLLLIEGPQGASHVGGGGCLRPCPCLLVASHDESTGILIFNVKGDLDLAFGSISLPGPKRRCPYDVASHFPVSQTCLISSTLPSSSQSGRNRTRFLCFSSLSFSSVCLHALN